MYSKAKYVVGVPVGGFGTSLCAVVLPENMNHSDVTSVFVPGSIRSAGFFHAESAGVVLYGRSSSLKLEVHADDEQLVGRAIAHSKYITD